MYNGFITYKHMLPIINIFSVFSPYISVHNMYGISAYFKEYLEIMTIENRFWSKILIVCHAVNIIVL